MDNEYRDPGKTMASGCPECGGTLSFDPALGKLKCDFCDSVFSPEEVEAYWAKNSAVQKAKEAAAKEGTNEQRGTVSLDENAMKSYSCSACGAELMADQTTAVMICPYCGNHTIAPSQFSGSIKPDYIIPFSHTKKEVQESYLNYYRKRFLLPGSFRSDNHVEEIQGVYVPFWMFSGEVAMNGDYVAYDEATDDEGHRYISDRYQVQIQGNETFEKVPADASKRMDDNLMDSIEPYNLNELKDFSMVYLPGFLAERYDVSEEESHQRAKKRIEEGIHTDVTEHIKRRMHHDGIENSKENFQYSGERTTYAMLPVWMLTTRWKDKSYKFAMNGQTGKMIGDLPISAPKMLSILIPVFAAIVLIFILLNRGDMEVGKIAGMLIVAFVVDLILFGILYGSMKPVHRATNASHYTEGFNITLQDEQRYGLFNAGKLRKRMKG